MANPTPPLPPQLLSEFDSVVLRMFKSVDYDVSRCVFAELTSAMSMIKLTWFRLIRRFESTRLAEAEFDLVNQITELKRQHIHRRNSRQPLCRIPTKMLTKSLSFMSAKDQLSVMRVCQHLREHVVEEPSLWTLVDQIRHPSALSFVLERARNLPVDITCLSVTGTDDIQFDALVAHMHHIRTLCVEFGQVRSWLAISSSTSACKAFTVATPIMQRLSIRAQKAVRYNDPPAMACYVTTPASTMPQLSSLQLCGINLDPDFYRQIQSLRSYSYSGRENTEFIGPAVAEQVSKTLSNLETINLELDWWNPAAGSEELGPAVQKINIHWNKPGLFVPRDAVPTRASWRLVRAIHVTHVHNDSDAPSGATLVPSMFVIPETTAPYQILGIRTSGAANKRAHVRAIDSEGRERVFCGIHPSTVMGMVAHIPGGSISTITISATAVALRALSDARCPLLRSIRFVLDTDDIVWLDSFILDVSKIRTLERLEFSQGTGPDTSQWTTTAVIRTISCCIASGNRLQEILFLGFSPEAQCLAMAGMFSQQVVVDQNWRELKSERAWFTEPSFEWF